MKTTQKTYTVHTFFGDYEVWLTRATYLSNKTLAIQAWCDEGPFATLTVNLENFLQGKDSAFVDTNNCPWAEQFIQDNGLGEPLGVYGESGWCTYPLYQFNLDEIPERK